METFSEPRIVSARPGDPVPPSTSGKAAAGGAGAAIGGILTAVVSGFIVRATGVELEPELHANILIVCTAIGSGVGGWIGAYFKRNYLT